jgi:pyruvate,water dikinase
MWRSAAAPPRGFAPQRSFASQQETYLNIRENTPSFQACKRCFASIFTNRAISYRVHRGFDHFQVALSIGVQKMVRSDKACSGVMFTMDTESGFPHVVYITGAYGLGENIVQGVINPDEFYVSARLRKLCPSFRRPSAEETNDLYHRGEA